MCAINVFVTLSLHKRGTERALERAGPVSLNNCTVSDKWTSLRVKLPGALAAI
jgi:hypothetical protein